MSTYNKDATHVRRSFAEEISKVAYGKHRLVIERNGKPMVAIVPLEELAFLESRAEEEESKWAINAYEKALAELVQSGEKPVPWDEYKRSRTSKRKAAPKRKVAKRK